MNESELLTRTAEELELKAKIAAAIKLRMKSRLLDDATAARIMGIQQIQLGQLIAGDFKSYTVDRLREHLHAIGA